MEFNTVEGKFYVASKDTGLYIRLFDFYGLTGVRPHPQLPVENISFLDCIPPIGHEAGFTHQLQYIGFRAAKRADKD